MAATVFPAPSSESLPTLATAKVFETFSQDGFLSYKPAGGLPAGRYAIVAEGLDVDYLEVNAPGFSYQGKGNTAYLTVPAGGAEITATASTFNDPGFLSTVKNFPLPTFAPEPEVEGTYSWNPGNAIAYNHSTSNWVLFARNSTSLELWTSTNGSAWSLASSGTNAWTFMGDPTTRGIIADVAYLKGALYATSFSPDGGGIYRTFDLTGRSGWSMVYNSAGGFNLFASPNPSSNRVFRSHQGQVLYSDNNGSSWTAVTVGSGLDTSNGLYSPVFKGNDIYIISSGRYYSSSQTSKIYRSTDDGASWTQVHDFGSTFIPTSMAYSPTLNRFAVTVMMPNDSNAMRVRYSDNDCSTFTYGGGFPGNPSDVSGRYLQHTIIWHNDRFVSVFTDGSNGPVRLGWSANAVDTFSNFIDPVGTVVTSLASTPIGVIYRCTGSTNGIGRTSDFVTFTQTGSNFTNPDGIAYSNGNYVISNATGTYLFGPNLDNLSLRSAPFNLYRVVAGNGVFLAKEPNNSTYVTSSDGINWTLGPSNTLMGIPSFAGGFFFRQDSSRNVHTSIDGVNWTFRANLPDFGGQSSLFDRFLKVKDVFVAFGRDVTGGATSYFYYSRDLVNWERTTSNTNQNVRNIAYSENPRGYVFQFNNGTGYSFGTGIDVGQTQISGVQMPTNTNSQLIQTGYAGKAENVSGLTLINRGYLAFGGSNSTTDQPTVRIYYAYPGPTAVSNQDLIADTDVNYQLPRADGQIFALNFNRNGIHRIRYGKPAAFAVYRLRD